MAYSPTLQLPLFLYMTRGFDIEDFYVVTPSSLVDGHQQFKATCCFILQNGSTVNYVTKPNATYFRLDESSSEA
jgi:hypothetical protein